VAYSYKLGTHCKYFVSRGQTVKSENGLAAIVSIAGISLPLQFKEISSSIAISNINLLPLKITALVSSDKCGEIISHCCEWTFCYQFFAAWKWISRIVCIRPLKPFFSIFRGSTLYIRKKYQ
jgi:hypothetical protein